MYRVPIIEIPDGHGEGFRLRILQAHDGDLYFSIVTGTEVISERSVRVCTGQGNPNHGEIHDHLFRAFEAAEQLGYRVDEK